MKASFHEDGSVSAIIMRWSDIKDFEDYITKGVGKDLLKAISIAQTNHALDNSHYTCEFIKAIDIVEGLVRQLTHLPVEEPASQ